MGLRRKLRTPKVKTVALIGLKLLVFRFGTCITCKIVIEVMCTQLHWPQTKNVQNRLALIYMF